jgi:hypothetical protein
MRRQVVFPQPDGPSSVKNSPSRALKSTDSTAAAAPNALLTPLNSTAGIATSGGVINLAIGFLFFCYNSVKFC